MNTQSTPTPELIALDGRALDHLMPMHLWFEPDGVVRRAGPTFRKLLGAIDPVGRSLFDLVQFRRVDGAKSAKAVLSRAGQRLSLVVTSLPDLPMRGHCVALPEGAGGLLDLSLGFSFPEAVELRKLTMSDFAPSDHTIDLLFLREAILSVAAESRRVTDRLVAAERSASTQASTDELTGLANRRALAAELDRLVDEAEGNFALMQLDLDHFKEINDTHGHHAGDEVLKRVAQVLKGVVRGRDMGARIGGDEFVLLIHGNDDVAVLDGVAERIIARLKEPIEIDGVAFSIGTSVGTTRSSLYAVPDADRMLRDADEALYASKRQGRGRNCYFQPPGLEKRAIP